MKYFYFILIFLLGTCVFAENIFDIHKSKGTMWDVHVLRKIPKVYDCDVPVYKEKAWAYDQFLTPEEKEFDKTNDNVRAIYYKGVDYNGNPTKVFAYIGVPEHPKGTKVPGMVLVHGGGGSAFEAWVRKWNAHGYAAIALDTTGCKSVNDRKGEHTEFGGPENVIDLDAPLKDQWPYQAVADVVLAGTILGNLDGVDKDKIGITGVSWGGYLTCIASSIDDRFKFAIPIYGAGFLFDYSPTIPHDEDTLNKWVVNWDPKIYLKDTKVPITWIVSNGDWGYWLLGVKKSFDVATVVDKKLVIIDGWKHGHVETAQIKEPITIADEYTQKKVIMPKIEVTDFRNSVASFIINIKTDKVICYWTEDENPKGHPSGDPKQGTKWNSFEVNYAGYKGKTSIPQEAKVFYLNAETSDGLRASSEIFVVK